MDTNRLILAVTGLVVLVGFVIWLVAAGAVMPNPKRLEQPELLLALYAYLAGFPAVLLLGGGLLLWFRFLKGK